MDLVLCQAREMQLYHLAGQALKRLQSHMTAIVMGTQNLDML